MKRKLLAAITLLMLAGVFFLLVSSLRPPTPVAFIRVVDPNGRPVAGAMITPDGLRPKKGGGHYWWGSGIERNGVKALTILTDSDGYAKVKYPFYVDEKLETGEISFAVDHPDFCADRPFRTVAASPPANAPIKEKLKYIGMRLLGRVHSRPEPVALRRGGIVRLTGYITQETNIVSDVQAEISHQGPAGTNFWRRSGPVLWTRKAMAGSAFLRAVFCLEGGKVLFSEPVSLNVIPGQTNELNLELKPGVRVTGRVSEKVPRPVPNGRVCTRVFMKDRDGYSAAPVWLGWREIQPDGTFAFDSLPPGRMEIIGLCDGFISQNGTPLPQGRTTSQRLPQLFTLDGEHQEITLKMEPAASCELTVLDDSGHPLTGATAGFWPNVLWGGNGSTVFADSLFNTEDFFRNRAPTDWEAIRERTKKDFHAQTDEKGIALVRNLPAGSQDYRVFHTNFDMPINPGDRSAGRSDSVQLSAGKTNKVSVTMQKKGTDAVTH